MILRNVAHASSLLSGMPAPSALKNSLTTYMHGMNMTQYPRKKEERGGAWSSTHVEEVVQCCRLLLIECPTFECVDFRMHKI